MSQDVERPRLGEILHYVAAKGDDEDAVKRGDEVPVLVTAVKRHPLYPTRFEIIGVGVTTNGFHEVHAFDDVDCRLPGTWHRDEDCLLDQGPVP